jgi:hypothetical protein
LVEEAAQMTETTPLAQAKDALLRALEQLERAEDEIGGPAERVDLVVVFSAGREVGDRWEAYDGWSVTAGPKWVHVALLDRTAQGLDNPVGALDDEDDDGIENQSCRWDD